MDLLSNHHSLPPLITIRGLMVPRTSPIGSSLPPLVSIQGLSTAAVHELPQEPHQIDVGQLLQAVNTYSRHNDLEQQRMLEALQEAQAMYESLQAMSREHNLKMEEVKNSTRDALQESERMRVRLTSTLQQVEQQRGVLRILLGEVIDLKQLRVEVAHLRDMNARLMEEALAIREEATEVVSKLAAQVEENERLGRQALVERDAQIHMLRSRLSASEERAEGAEGEAETLRNLNNELRNNTDTANLECQLAALEDIAEQLKRKVEVLLNENGKLNNDTTEMSKLQSQLAASEGEVAQLSRQVEELHHDTTEKSDLQSQLAASEVKVAQLSRQVEELDNDIAAISKLKSQPAASEGNTEQLKGEVEALRKDNDKLISGHDELRKENDKRINDYDELRKNNNKLLNDHDELRKNNDKLLNDHDELLKENDKRINDYDELRKKNEKLINDYDELRKNNDKLLNDHDELRKNNDKLLNDHDVLLEDNQKMLKEKVEMEEHLQTGRSAVLECQRLEADLKQVNMSKGFYLEKWLSLRGPIRAVCRIRPAGDPLKPQAEGIRTQISNDEHGAFLEVYRKAKSSLADAAVKSASDNRKAWRLDQIFTPADDNNTIWMEISPLLESAIDGAQVIVILFGRTGTGKSFTSEGIWSRLGQCLLTDTEDSNSSNGSSGDVAEDLREGQIRLWSTEVYCGELHDLLVVTKKKKKKEDTHAGKLVLPSSSGVLDPVRQCGASSVVVSTRGGLNAALQQVSRARISAQTRANDNSSRSHSFTCVELPAGGSITLVDLAGQERNGVADSKTELSSINSSLTALTQALGKLVTSLRNAGSKGPRGEAGQQATPKKGGEKKSQEGKATPSKGNNSPPKGKNSPPKGDGSPPGQNATPDKTTLTQGIENVWSSPQLLPRVVGALMLRGSQHGGLELKSKVMFLATLDFSTVESTKASEQTLDELQRSGLITGQ